jgi:hypothetical protein
MAAILKNLTAFQSVTNNYLIFRGEDSNACSLHSGQHVHGTI